MTYYVEVRSVVQRVGAPRLVPLAEVEGYRGFRSVFAFDEDTAEHIRATGGMRGLRGAKVYADTLFMDFDGHDPHEFRDWLMTSGLAWDEYDSGNRSVHFHIPMEPIFAQWAPQAMRDWTRLMAPTADVSFLHPAGQYRLPGTYHAKSPGRRKQLVRAALGAPLLLLKPATYVPIRAYVGEDRGPEQFYGMLMTHRGQGQRRPWLWQAATVGAEAGLSMEEVFAGLDAWNTNFCNPPHDPVTVLKQVESAFYQLSQRR